MLVRGITLRDYRNVREADVRFTEGVNLLVGDNAQGKTNLLEGIYLFALGKSFRGAKEAELIRFGAEVASLGLDFASGGREQSAVIRMGAAGGRRRVVELNRVRLSRMSELIGSFRAVLFCPEHLSLIKDGPAVRRAYLDIAISQLRPVYLRALQRYNAVLRERNRLLKSADEQPRVFRETIELWSAQLAEQRVAVARALAAKPSLILADEPTGNLDSKTGDDIMNLFCELNDAGITIVLITHSEKVAAQARRRIRIMDGHVEDCGNETSPISQKRGESA